MFKYALMLLLSLSVTAAPAMAKDSAGNKLDVEASMLVDGSIDVDPDGSVAALSLSNPDKLTKPLRDLIERSVKQWRFEPVLVNGNPAPVRADMHLRLVANPQVGGDYRVRIASAYFGKQDEAREAGEILSVDQKPGMNRLINGFADIGVPGTVYVALKINRDGKVEDIDTEQVNLWAKGTPVQMEKARAGLAKLVTDTIRGWSFRIPTTGKDADKPYWTGRLPVELCFSDQKGCMRKDDAWHAYVPGPAKSIPWMKDDGGHADALPAGEFQTGNNMLKLLTPLTSG